MISKPDFEKKQILFVFGGEGEKLSFLNDNIIVKDAEGKTKHQSTCYRLFAVFVVGEVTITSGLIQRAKKFGFTICLMTRAMRVYEYLGAKMEGNTLLRQKQYEYNGLEVAGHILRNKLSNQQAVLKKIRHRSENTNAAIKKIDEYKERLNDSSLRLQEMLGLEGLSARIYFKELFADYEWKGRKPRIKCDYINSTLDIGYTVLFEFIDALLNTFGFDTYRGVLHRQFYMRKSLVCDIVEPFRPMIDVQIRKSLNYNQIKKEDFEKFGERYTLSWKNSPKYISFLAKPLIENKASIFEYVQKYYRSFMKQVEISEYPVFEVI